MNNIHELRHFPIAPRAMRRARLILQVPRRMVSKFCCLIQSSFVIVVAHAFCKLIVLSQIYFFESFRIYNIPHNYGIPQVMLHSRANLSLLLPSPLRVVLFPPLIVDRSTYPESCRFRSEICFARGKKVCN